MIAGRKRPRRQSTQATRRHHARRLRQQPQLVRRLVEPVDQQQLACPACARLGQRQLRRGCGSAFVAGGAAATAAQAGERVLRAHAVVGVLVALDRLPEELARALVLAEREPRAARPVEQAGRGRTRRAPPRRSLERRRRLLEASRRGSRPSRRARRRAPRSVRPGTPPAAAATRVRRCRRARPSGSGSRATSSASSPHGVPREAVGDRQVGLPRVRVSARGLGGEPERRLGRVRRSRRRPSSSSARPSVRRPRATRARPSRTRARSASSGAQAGELDGAQRLERLAGAPSGEQRRAALELQRAPARRRCAAAARPRVPRGARGPASPPAARGNSRSRRSKAAAAAARSPRASCRVAELEQGRSGSRAGHEATVRWSVASA